MILMVSLLASCGTKEDNTTNTTANTNTEQTVSSTNSKEDTSESIKGETEKAEESNEQVMSITADLFMPAQVIDMTAEPVLDVLNDTWEDEKMLKREYLDVEFLGRKITIGGTTFGDLIKSFDGYSEFFDSSQAELDKEIHPYHKLKFNFTFDDAYVTFEVFNNTENVKKLEDLPVCSILVDGIELKHTHSSTDNREWISGEKYNITLNSELLQIEPEDNNKVNKYLLSLTTGVTETGKADSIDSGIVEIKGNPINIKTMHLADITSLLGEDEYICYPEYSIGIYFDYLSSGQEHIYSSQGYATYSYEDNDAMYTFFTHELKEGNLWEAPIEFCTLEFEDAVEGFRVAGFDSSITLEQLQSWYNKEIKNKETYGDITEDSLQFEIEVKDDAMIKDANSGNLATLSSFAGEYDMAVLEYEFMFYEGVLEEITISRNADIK